MNTNDTNDTNDTVFFSSAAADHIQQVRLTTPRLSDGSDICPGSRSGAALATAMASWDDSFTAAESSTEMLIRDATLFLSTLADLDSATAASLSGSSGAL